MDKRALSKELLTRVSKVVNNFEAEFNCCVKSLTAELNNVDTTGIEGIEGENIISRQYKTNIVTEEDATEEDWRNIT